MTAPKKTDPLTPEEVRAAADSYFELFEIIAAKAPNASIEEGLKLAEVIFTYAHKLRAIDLEENSSAPFGFNKKDV